MQVFTLLTAVLEKLNESEVIETLGSDINNVQDLASTVIDRCEKAMLEHARPALELAVQSAAKLKRIIDLCPDPEEDEKAFLAIGLMS